MTHGEPQIVYHLDRSRELETGRRLDLVEVPSMPAGGPDLSAEWPDGMSRHGRRYATEWVSGATEPEWMFELLRRSEFPALPSRLASAFGFGALADARAFRYHFGGDLTVPIRRLRGRVTHRGNLFLLRATQPPAAVLAHARDYWSGRSGPAPELWELLLEPGAEVIGTAGEDEPG